MDMAYKQRRENIEDLVNQFLKKHPNAAGMGDDYIFQNDDAQIDAMQLVADICDLFESGPILIPYNEVPEEDRHCLFCVHVEKSMELDECRECLKINKRINWYPKEK